MSSHHPANAAPVTSDRSLVDSLHHEIRTPMTAILGFADLIEADLDENRPAAELREAVRTIQRSGRHLLDLVTTILDVSGINDTGHVRVPEPVCLESLCRGLIDHAADAASRASLGLRAVFIGDVPASMPTDAHRLRVVLSGLLANALRFTDAGGVELRVSVRQGAGVDREICFDIIDTGIGMTPAQAERLSDPARIASGDGTNAAGLGLQLCHATAALMGGRIEVRSHLGAGSRVGLRLPLTTPADAPRIGIEVITPMRDDAARPDREFLPLAGCRVLLVEDGPDNQTLLRFLLRRAGADVELAADGVEAMAFADEVNSAFDLVLMDMHMPRMDGYAATERLRATGCTVPVIALTAHARRGDRELCLKAGCDDYVTKPIDRLALIETCKKWMLGDLCRAA